MGSIDWIPIADLPDALKDGRDLLLCRDFDSGPFLGRWIAPSDFLTEREIEAHGLSDCADEPDWFYADYVQGGRLSDGLPTHFAEINAPEASMPGFEG